MLNSRSTQSAFISRSMPDGSKVGLMKNLSGCDNMSTFVQPSTHTHTDTQTQTKPHMVCTSAEQCRDDLFFLVLGSFPQSHQESPIRLLDIHDEFMMFMVRSWSVHDVLNF